MSRSLAWCLLWLLPPAIGAGEVAGLRLWDGPEYTRVVLDLSAPIEHRLFALRDPDRVVIDLPRTRLRADAAAIPARGRVKGVRSGVHQGRDLRLVIDLVGQSRVKSFLLPPAEGSGHRLVIDLYPPRAEPRPSEAPVASGDREVIIAIDAGHGGEDPGAIGPSGTREKDVTLAIARKLAAAIDAEPGMKAVLIREGDYYIPLQRRYMLARQARADLFVSIHADAFHDQRAAGSSVYVLSPRGASSEAARWLAERENRSDLVGGVSLADKDDLLAAVLLDLSQGATLEASHRAARHVLKALSAVGRVHKREVERAGFMVLRSPDVPSVLIETAFISNPAEEMRLRDDRHQSRIAAAILEGIRRYFEETPPPGTLLARQALERPVKHVVQPGETLSAIARRHRVSLTALRAANGLRGDRVRAGEILTIPARGSG
ncbi:MAG: N-acetylmuramoyl-L-alanine amidase [Lysobacterales bacterium]|jgi:N-acetylmuramoyl-L-alanine amidase|nr:MAG: N-acetylmuramoyl-L-alanine amidase [Xanthomonadales bacterium]